ncbi:hypothetical protein EG863_15400, partial [Enterococcus faecalis]
LGERQRARLGRREPGGAAPRRARARRRGRGRAPARANVGARGSAPGRGRRRVQIKRFFPHARVLFQP